MNQADVAQTLGRINPFASYFGDREDKEHTNHYLI
jgi:hypothetical protein